MDKFEQFKKEYDLLLNFCQPWLTEESEFEFYIETAMLRIWSGNGRYSEDYSTAIETISGRKRTPVQITQAMLDSTEPGELAKIPSFFARMVEDDFAKGSRNARGFVNDLKSLLAAAAMINGDFTIEESNMLSGELKRLMTYAISQGVKVDYATGRIRSKITPLKEDSYVPLDAQASVNADLIFDALERDFLRPGRTPSGGKGNTESRDSATGGSGSGSSGPRSGAGNDTGADNHVTPQAAGNVQPENAVEVKEDPRTMEELMEELDSLVGLTGIKEDIRSLMNFITITKMREERGLNVPTISYHLVFTGNPGTGKTTVARLVAGLYHRIGILPKGQLVETERSQLVAGYIGQTAIKTREVIQQAMGGVLFIDEAYALVNDDQDSFGKEAIETILKAMEDHRDELVVIVAGYTELMHKFIESNPGFRSRFSKYFEFPDYTGEQLLEIFKTFCRKNGYHLTEEAEAYLLLQFNEMYEHRDSHFGNGRTARNVFEKAINQQANRLAGLAGADPTGFAAPKQSQEDAPEQSQEAAPEQSQEAAPEESPEAGDEQSPRTAPEQSPQPASSEITDRQLQELTKEDLEAAVEAENRKIEI